MVHAENGDAIDVLVKQALADRANRAALARADAPARDRGRGDEPRDPARARRGLPAVRRPRLVQGVGRADRARAREGLGRLGRDVHAVLLRRHDVPRAAGLRGREVRLHAAAARQGEPGRALGRGADRRALGRSRPTTARSTGTARRRSGKDDFSKIPNGGPGPREPPADDPHFGVREGRITLNRMVELLSTNPAKLFGLYPRKGTLARRLRRRHRRLRPREARRRSRAADHHSRIDYNLYEGTEVIGSPATRAAARQGPCRERRARSQPGIGEFVERAKFGQELHAAAATA